MKYNQEKITKLKSEIHKSIALLDGLKELSLNEFSNDIHKISSAKYNFIIAIEGMIDICNHIVSQNNFDTPSDYADAFNIMHKKGAFDEELLKNLIKASRFRNRLVHIYWDVDINELYKILQSDLKDIRSFLKQITDFIEINSNQK